MVSKEEAVNYFIISEISWTEKKHGNHSQNGRSLSLGMNPRPPKTKQEC
jgi:hypothetical protein